MHLKGTNKKQLTKYTEYTMFMFLCETSSQSIFFTSIYIHSYKQKKVN